MKLLLLSTLLLLNFSLLNGQETQKETNFLAFGIKYGYEIPIGELEERFGNNFHAVVSADYYSKDWDGFFGLEMDFQFGDQVNEDVLAPLRSSSGALLGLNGAIAPVQLRRRGVYIGAYINKNLLKNKNHPGSGLNLGLGLGLWQHKIRLQEESPNAGHINGNYEKGYDRLTRGPALKQTLQYLHLSSKNPVRYSVGISLTEGFTESVRAINFDTGESAKGSRMDMVISLDLKWFIPLAKGSDSDEIFY